MTDRQLEYILEIARQGNITTAAQKLHISQPSLSNVLAHVEDEAGAKFFDRSLSPMPLTYTGELYVQTAKKILAAMDEFRQHMNDVRDARIERLNIGCGPQQSPFIIPVVLPLLLKSYPGVQYHLTEDSPSLLEEQLLAGALDVVFRGGKIRSPAVKNVLLLREAMLLLAPKALGFSDGGGKNAVCSRADLHKAGKVPFVLMKRNHQLRIMIDRIFADMEYSPHIILETDSWETCLQMVKNGIALTILPDARRDIEDKRVCKYRLQGAYYRPTFLCYRKNATLSKVMSECIDIALSVFEE
ncbi:MAG: LysR family transcriptional regulator [Treponema sp.]|jgi:DNA-binding transcriptional LysR family regulator|nr:LysR family transcriptional regulator [Treponema sp.]